MDYNIVTLEIADLLVHFDYYDQLVTEACATEEQAKIRNKRKEHLALNFANAKFHDSKKQLLPLNQLKELIIVRLKLMKNKEVHELVEQLEKDTKKIKKLYKALAKK
jgi:predicted transcriptional regulator